MSEEPGEVASSSEGGHVLGQELGDAIVAWAQRLETRLDGMQDVEYLWEPVEGCWSVRPTAGGVWRPDLGPRGSTWTDASPPPVTTIAWRMWHLGASPTPTWPPENAPSARSFSTAWFTQPRQDTAGGIGTADAAVEAVRRHWSAVGGRVATYPDDELLEPIGEIGGQFRDASIHALIVHVADELIHHSAEIALLRDLYRATSGRT